MGSNQREPTMEEIDKILTVYCMPDNADHFASRKKGRLTLIIRETDTHWYLDSENYPIIEKKVTPGNVKYVQLAISALNPEYMVKSCSYFDIFAVTKYKQDIPIEGTDKTPDYHTSEIIIEYKTFFNQYNPDRIKEEKINTYKKYARFGKPILLIFTIVSTRYFEEFNVDTRDQKMMFYLVGQFNYHNGYDNPTKIRESELKPFSEILKELPWKIKDLEKKGLNPESELIPKRIRQLLKKKEYLSADQLDSDIFELFKVGEKFVDYNMLDQVNFMERIAEMYKTEEKYNPNISWKHLWSRDGNRERFKTKFGHRATYLMDFVVTISTEGNMSTREILELIKIGLAVSKNPILSYFEFYLKHESEIESVAEITKNVAFLKTEFNGLTIDKDTDTIIMERQKKLLEAASNEKNKLINSFNSSYSSDMFKMNAQGLLVPQGERLNVIRNKAKSKRKAKKEVHDMNPLKNKDAVDCIEWQENPKHFEEVLADLFSRAPKQKMDIPQLPEKATEGPYLSNETLNENSKQLLKIAKDNLSEVLGSETCRMLYGQMRAATCLIMNDKRTGQNTGNPDAIKISRVPGHKVWILSGLAPNTITSGFVWTLGVHPIDEEVPGYIPPTERIPLGNEALWLTGPYRVNRKVLNKAEQTFGGFVSTCLMYNDMGIKIWENLMYCSLYMRYTRELAAISDLVYLAYKNVYSFFTLGKYEFLDKFPSFYFKDPRVAYIFNKLNSQYPALVEIMRSRALSDNLGFDFIDPVFGFQHRSVQSFLSVTYLKQIFPKDDGYDEKHKAFEFFKKEEKQQADYERSPFRTDRWGHNSRKVEEFIKAKFPQGPYTHKWNSFSFWPDVCYSILKNVMEDTMAVNPVMFNKENFRNDVGIDTGTNKKVLMPMSQSLMSSMKFEKGENPTRTPGIASVNQQESLTLEDIAAREFFKKDSKLPPGHPNKIFSDSLYKYLDKEALRLKDVVIYEILHYPKRSIVTLVIKEQSGYDKRIFFVQTINKRNLHVLLESSWFNFLRKTVEDMITTPGDEKLIKIEQAVNKISPTSNDYIVLTIDQTKFGDEYPLDALMFLYIVGYQVGYFTKEQAYLGLFSLYTRQERLEIMPPDTMNLANNPGRLQHFVEEFGTDHHLLRYMALNPRSFSNYGAHKVFDDPFNKVFSDKAELYKIKGLIKQVGFVLGVENFGASTLSLVYMWWIKRILNKRGLMNSLEGHTHSDDAYMVLAARLREYLDFSTVDLQKPQFSKLGGTKPSFMDAFKNAKSIKIDNKSFTTSIGDGENVYTYGNEYIIKMVAVMSVMLSSTVGQRNSLGKWMCSPQGEVLQAYIINRKVITPLIRYVASLYADLPGKSPANDLSSISGRLYNIGNHGGTISLSVSLQLFMNMFTSYRYGIHSYHDESTDKKFRSHLTDLKRWLYPPELTGFWFAHPTMIFESGFKANEIRLQMNAELSTELKTALECMADTDDIWLQKSKVETNYDHAFETTTQSDGLIEISTDEPDGGAPESRKDFLIRWARNYKTNRAFTILYEKIFPLMNIEEEIMQMEEKDRSRPGKVVKHLCNLWKIDELLHTKEAQKKFMFFLKRYLSATFQESYLRIHEAVKIINKFGWLNRTMSWCFSDKFTAELVSSGIEMKPSLTVKEIMELVCRKITLSQINSLKGVKIRQLYLSVFNFDIHIHTNYKRVARGFRYKTQDLEYILSWTSPTTEIKRNILSFPFKLLAPRLMEVYVPMYSQYSSPSNSLLFERNPYLRYNELFQDQVKVLHELLIASGIQPLQIADHMTLLDRLLKGVVIHRVGRFPAQIDIADRIEELQHDRTFDYQIESGSLTQTFIQPPLQTSWTPDDVADVLQLLKWQIRLTVNFRPSEQNLINYKGRNILLSELFRIANGILAKTNRNYSRKTLEINTSLMLIDMAMSPKATGIRRIYRHYLPNMLLLAFEHLSSIVILRIYRHRSGDRRWVASFGIETTVTDTEYIVRHCTWLSYLFANPSCRFNLDKLRKTKGNMKLQTDQNGDRYFLRGSESNIEVVLSDVDSVLKNLKNMAMSTYNVASDIWSIEQNEMYNKFMRRGIPVDDDGLQKSKFVIDNWDTSHTTHLLTINEQPINKILYTIEDWDLNTDHWKSTLLGFAVSYTRIETSFVETHPDYQSDVMKICIMSKLQMITGLTEDELIVLGDAMIESMENPFFKEKYSREIRQLKGEAFRASKTGQTIDINYELAKRYIGTDDKSLPLVVTLPKDICSIMIQNDLSILVKNFKHVMKHRKDPREIRDEAFNALEDMIHSNSYAERSENIERIGFILEPKNIKFKHPLGSKGTDNKVHRNNLKIMLSIFGHDATNLLNNLKPTKASYHTGFTPIVWNRILFNVPEIQWAARFFVIPKFD